jgi:Zn ribbon nucleic-acid-binding protein
MKCPNCKTETKTVNRVSWKGKSVVWEECPLCGFSRPPNTLRITEIFAFVSVDENDQEGVIAINTILGPTPMIAADKARLEYLRPHAERVAKEMGIKVRLLRFSTREEVEEF